MDNLVFICFKWEHTGATALLLRRCWLLLGVNPRGMDDLVLICFVVSLLEPLAHPAKHGRVDACIV